MNVRATWFLVAACVLLSALCAVSEPASAGLAGSPRIIGGTGAVDGEFPFMAALVKSAITNDFDAKFCGGTVIAPRWILTAGHCVSGQRASDIQVITGVTTIATAAPFATRINVAHIVLHPEYSGAPPLNDVALLHLASDAVTAPGYTLDTGSTFPLLTNGVDVTATGWGLTAQNVGSPPHDTYATTLQKTVLDIFPRESCTALFDGPFGGDMICAGFSSGAMRDTCFGDSGGPLLYPLGGGAWQQVGITSYGSDPCATLNEPGIYTGVWFFSSFITGAQTMPDLDLTLGVTPGSEFGIHVQPYVIVKNLSTVMSAGNATATITLRGDIAVMNLATLLACNHTITGAGMSKVTTLVCTLGTLVPEASQQFDMTLELYGSGPFSASARATTSSGDYYPSNDRASRPFTGSQIAPSTAKSSGSGSVDPALWLLVLLMIPARLRRRAR